MHNVAGIEALTANLFLVGLTALNLLRIQGLLRTAMRSITLENDQRSGYLLDECRLPDCIMRDGVNLAPGFLEESVCAAGAGRRNDLLQNELLQVALARGVRAPAGEVQPVELPQHALHDEAQPAVALLFLHGNHQVAERCSWNIATDQMDSHLLR